MCLGDCQGNGRGENEARAKLHSSFRFTSPFPWTDALCTTASHSRDLQRLVVAAVGAHGPVVVDLGAASQAGLHAVTPLGARAELGPVGRDLRRQAVIEQVEHQQIDAAHLLVVDPIAGDTDTAAHVHLERRKPLDEVEHEHVGPAGVVGHHPERDARDDAVRALDAEAHVASVVMVAVGMDPGVVVVRVAVDVDGVTVAAATVITDDGDVAGISVVGRDGHLGEAEEHVTERLEQHDGCLPCRIVDVMVG